MVTGQTNVTTEHVEKAWDLIKSTARTLHDLICQKLLFPILIPKRSILNIRLR